MTFEVTYPKLETSQNDRVKLVKPGDVVTPPAKCIVCGGIMTNGKVLIDFGFYIQHYGNVQFCNICFGQAATAFGYIDTESPKYKKLLADTRAVVQQAKDLADENEILRDYERIVETIRDSGSLSNSYIGTVPLGSSSEVTATVEIPERGARQNIGIAKNSSNDGTRASSAAIKPNTKSGPTHVRSATEFDLSDIGDIGNI